MALLEIKLYPDPVLRLEAKAVPKVTASIRKLLDDMAETMRAAEGVGLAAPQVGVSKRIIIVDVGEGLIELINPRLEKREGLETAMEGCLSIPQYVGEVERAATVTVVGLNREGEEIRITGSGLLARALQHEIDHLNGILFIDRAKNLYEKKPGQAEDGGSKEGQRASAAASAAEGTGEPGSENDGSQGKTLRNDP